MRNGSTSKQSGSGANALDVARDAFRLLVTGPQPLAVNGVAFTGLPDKPIPLNEVRDVLLSRQCPPGTADAVWTYLVRRSRAEGASWTVGAVGVALPALTSVARCLGRRYPGDRADLAAEVLRGFLDELPRVDLGRPRIVLRLRWAAYRAGHKALTTALTDRAMCVSGAEAGPRYVPTGHPDFVLARAVADGVLSSAEAELIGATRLESVTIDQWATSRGITHWAAYKARRRAELRLVAYIKGILLDPDPLDELTDRVAALISLGRTPTDHASTASPSKAEGDLGLQCRGKVSPNAASSEERSCA